MTLKAPFPWFGGKSLVAPVVWERFGNVPNYVEPFFGSGAVLLGRPTTPNVETVNDKDAFVSNFWRATKHDGEKVAEWCDWPANENDLHARHAWLVERRENLSAQVEGDPEYYDAKIAGWWCWGLSLWIGGKWCSGNGPWQAVDGQLIHLGTKGQGVRRQLIHLWHKGQGVHRQLIHLGNKGRGVHHQHSGLHEWFEALKDRMRRVRVCSGDWSRVCGPTPTFKQGLTGVFLDPPYSGDAGRDNEIYTEEDLNVAADVRAWCLENGSNPEMRIALCGYEGEHEMPDDWECFQWKAQGGYGSRSGKGLENRHRERIWFSPHCIRPQDYLF
jgi:site-specific DNA-adenine methylase